MKRVPTTKNLIIIVVALFLISMPSLVRSHSYDFYTVDEEVNVGENVTGIAIDSNGNAGICYYDSTNKVLKFASFDGDDWSSEIADNDGGSGDAVGINCAIVYDDDDNPNIVYFNTTDQEIRHAKKAGGFWEVSVVDDNIESDFLNLDISRLSIAKKSTGDIGIAYYDGGVDANLKYALYDGNDWSSETADDDGDVGRYPSLDYDSMDNPGIAYMKYINDAEASLNYVYYDGGDWLAEEEVHSEDYSGLEKTLKFDSDDNPHIVFRQVDENNLQRLRYAKKTDGEWEDSVVISTGSAELADEGVYVQMVMDSANNSFIVYRSYFRSGLFGQNNFIRLSSYYFTDDDAVAKIQGETLTHTFGVLTELSGMAIALDDDYNMAISWVAEQGDGSFDLRAAILSEWGQALSLTTPNDDNFEAEDRFTLSWRDFAPDANADIQFFLQDALFNETLVGSAKENDANSLEIDTSQIEPGEYTVIGRISVDNFQTNSTDTAPVLLEVQDHPAADPVVDNPVDPAAIDVDDDDSAAGQVDNGDSDDSADSGDASGIDASDLQTLQNAASAMGCSLMPLQKRKR